MTQNVREQVRQRYAAAAVALAQGPDSECGCDPPQASCCTAATPHEGDVRAGEVVFGGGLYGAAEAEAAGGAIEASLGCGVPTAVADLKDGDVVLDLGSGAGGDALISAKRVAPSGKVFGLDMTVEMLDLARANAAKAEVDNIEFLQGYLEEIPLPDASVDVVISNCVINLAADKSVVLAEAARVTRPGGRFAVSDVVATDQAELTARANAADYAGCIVGALTEAEYQAALTVAGWRDIAIERTHQVADEAYAAIIRATRG